MIKSQNVLPISQIRQLQQEDDKAKITRLEAALAAEKEDKLAIIEATAQVYEELQAIKSKVVGPSI